MAFLKCRNDYINIDQINSFSKSTKWPGFVCITCSKGQVYWEGNCEALALLLESMKISDQVQEAIQPLIILTREQQRLLEQTKDYTEELQDQIDILKLELNALQDRAKNVHI